MLPKAYFDQVWARCDLYSGLHAYLSAHATVALQPDELLRAEWAARVSALDLYVHELVAQRLVEIFTGSRPTCPGFAKMQISAEAMMRIQGARDAASQASAFDLEVRTKLSRITFQHPDDIADGIRFVSTKKLWNEVANALGATPAPMAAQTETIKRRLAAIVDRRNKIVHEGDMQPTTPREPWPIAASDVADVKALITSIVGAIDGIV